MPLDMSMNTGGKDLHWIWLMPSCRLWPEWCKRGGKEKDSEGSDILSVCFLDRVLWPDALCLPCCGGLTFLKRPITVYSVRYLHKNMIQYWHVIITPHFKIWFFLILQRHHSLRHLRMSLLMDIWFVFSLQIISLNNQLTKQPLKSRNNTDLFSVSTSQIAIKILPSIPQNIVYKESSLEIWSHLVVGTL